MQAALPILYLFFGLAVGGLVVFALSRWIKWLDYTVVTFLIGVATSLIVSAAQLEHYTEPLSESILQWSAIDPELIIFAFLPVLLFGEAQTLNFLQVKLVFPSAFLLALPGACFVAWLLALACKYVFQFDWDWGLCWLVGSVLCATDPVAVVAVLKNVSSDASSQRRLTYLIVGEALLNDATGLVLFGIIGNKTANSLGGDATVLAFAIYFIRVILISPLLGAAVGFAATFCLRCFDRRLKSEDSTMQVATTVVCAYLSFFIAQYNVGVSGVISCCAAGLVVSYQGGPLILSHDTLHTIWSLLEWTGNTIIFLISGLIVGSRSSLFSHSPTAVWSIFAMYLALLVTRATLLALLHLPINYMVPEYGWRHACFSCFSGLRGGVSLCLALFMYSHSDDRRGDHASDKLILFPAHHIDEAAFMICWATALTIIINGSLVPTALDWLGLAPKEDHHDSIMVHYVEARLRLSMAKHYLHLKTEFPEHDPAFVLRACSILRDERREGEEQGDLQHHGPRGTQYTRPSVWIGSIPVPSLGNVRDPDPEACELARAGGGGEGGSDSLDGRDAEVAVAATADALSLHASSSHVEVGVSEVDGVDSAGRSFLSASSPVSALGSVPVPVPVPVSVLGSGTAASGAAPDSPSKASSLAGTDVGDPSSIFINASRNFTATDLTKGWVGVMSSAALSPKMQRRVNGIDEAVDEELVVQFRTLLLQVVRLRYAQHIKQGKLPRGSDAALNLFDSVDYGLEFTQSPQGGFQDWSFLLGKLSDGFFETCLDRIVAWLRRISGLSRARSGSVESEADVVHQQQNRQQTQQQRQNGEASTSTTKKAPILRRSSISNLVLGGADADSAASTSPASGSQESEAAGFLACCLSASGVLWALQSLLAKIVERRQEDEVYCLLCFIDAHEYAQKRMVHYLGPDEYINTAEEALIVAESSAIVQQAKEAMKSRFPPATLSRILSKKVATILLHAEEDLILHFFEEKLLSASDAGYLETFPRVDKRRLDYKG